jgi:ParB/Sulfiredoxin domain
MAQANGHDMTAHTFGSDRTDSGESSGRSEFDLKNLERLPARDVPVDALSPGLALRQGGTDSAHIQLLADSADSASLPPVLVQLDGYRIIDGLHRLEAARLRGEDSIRARFLDCSDSEALVIAMKANGAHGLPLAKADRISGARRVLCSHSDWSDRAIAGITGLSARTIASLRARSVDPASLDPGSPDRTSPGTAPPGTAPLGTAPLGTAPLDAKRIGLDGRRRPVDASESRRRAAEYIRAHPDAPLRQVARDTDVSLGTAHDVSTRLRRGESPERNARHRTGAPVRSVQPVHPLPAQPGPPVQPLRSVQPVRPVRPVPPADDATRPGTVDPDPGPRVPLRVAPSIDGTAPRRNQNDAAPSWAAVAAKMANDPAIRYTAGGREFLRWMQLHATDPDDEWRELVDVVPPHWLGVVAPIAERIAQEWGLLAERLKTKQRMMS